MPKWELSGTIFSSYSKGGGEGKGLYAAPRRIMQTSAVNRHVIQVIENERNEPPSTAASTPTTSTSGQTNTPIPMTNGPVPCPPPSIFPPKPAKSILKAPSMDTQPNLFRSIPMPPIVSGTGRRALLPDPRTVLHHPPRLFAV